MPTEKIQKANALGSTINNWSKIIIGLVIFILGVGTTYYKIESNASTNIKQDDQFKEILHEMTREFQISHEEIEDNYERAMQEATELHNHDHEQDKKLMELTKELWYLKGKLDEQDKNK
jgi:uncharacterized protein HemX